MKYVIFCLLSGEAKEYHTHLMHDVSERFQVHVALNRKPPSHLTLKYTFEINRIQELEDVVGKFCMKYNKSSYVLEGFSHFDDRVIFMDVLPSDAMVKTQREFKKRLRNLDWLKWDDIESQETKFHATIARQDISERFDDIWRYVNKEKPEFECSFDNIAIMRLEQGVWKVYREFKLC